MEESDDFSYAVVYNIPRKLSSKDLRRFFSYFVEQERFNCFYYRHRPEARAPRSWCLPVQEEARRHFCCIVRLRTKDRDEFVERYNDKLWYDWNGQLMSEKCYIITVADEWPMLSEEVKRSPAAYASCSFASSVFLMELKPPAFMPQGNVGTSTACFMQIIGMCRFPPTLIKRLGLSFSAKQASSSCQVGFDYGITTNRLAPIGNGLINSDIEGAVIRSSRRLEETEEELNVDGWGPYDDNEDRDRCEEWERHEALHDDVDSQERLEERLYEEDIEVVWEKGGPGLVFYTDTYHWDQLEPDTDAKWADDWDVDMGVYYGEQGDMDARDLLDVRRSQMLGNSDHSESVFRKKPKGKSKRQRKIKKSEQQIPEAAASNNSEFGSFEAHTKGIGRKLLLKHGWEEGKGLGTSEAGHPYPVALEMMTGAQNPRCHKGLGYHGKKLSRKPKPRPPDKHIISTVYDSEDPYPGDTLLRRAELAHNKDI